MRWSQSILQSTCALGLPLFQSIPIKNVQTLGGSSLSLHVLPEKRIKLENSPHSSALDLECRSSGLACNLSRFAMHAVVIQKDHHDHECVAYAILNFPVVRDAYMNMVAPGESRHAR